MTRGWQAPPPSRQAALERAAAMQPAAYARTRNHLEGHVSGLSPYITHGVVTLHEVVTQVVTRHPLEVNHKWIYELGWREYFRHVWAHVGSGILQSRHPGVLPEDAYAREIPIDVCCGQTDVPAVNEAVKMLYATGHLHNHARMWLASYLVHLRRIHWRTGADWMVSHLLDGDLASNHLSWQWVAATHSHKPYLFNADNVARFAPASWHSKDTSIDQPYEVLEQIARGLRVPITAQCAIRHDSLVPPHPCSQLHGAEALTNLDDLARHIQGREVWLVHPWALRPPPAHRESSLVVGVYLQNYHDAWPWTERRWQWVDTVMRELTPLRVHADVARLQKALSGARAVHSVDEPHLNPWLQSLAQLDPCPTLFPAVDRLCPSFSQWWTRATRGLKLASQLCE